MSVWPGVSWELDNRAQLFFASQVMPHFYYFVVPANGFSISTALGTWHGTTERIQNTVS